MPFLLAKLLENEAKKSAFFAHFGRFVHKNSLAKACRFDEKSIFGANFR